LVEIIICVLENAQINPIRDRGSRWETYITHSHVKAPAVQQSSRKLCAPRQVVALTVMRMGRLSFIIALGAMVVNW
jgi:hypothetical protein